MIPLQPFHVSSVAYPAPTSQPVHQPPYKPSFHLIVVLSSRFSILIWAAAKEQQLICYAKETLLLSIYLYFGPRKFLGFNPQNSRLMGCHGHVRKYEVPRLQGRSTNQIPKKTPLQPHMSQGADYRGLYRILGV